jgi:hypothetical protein
LKLHDLEFIHRKHKNCNAGTWFYFSLADCFALQCHLLLCSIAADHTRFLIQMAISSSQLGDDTTSSPIDALRFRLVNDQHSLCMIQPWRGDLFSQKFKHHVHLQVLRICNMLHMIQIVYIDCISMTLPDVYNTIMVFTVMST